MATEKLTYSDLPMTTATAGTTYTLDAFENRSIASGTMIDLAGTEGLKFQLDGSLYAPGGIMSYGMSGQEAPAIRVNVGKSGHLESDFYGLAIYADGSIVRNAGTISAGSSEAVKMTGDGVRLENTGMIMSMDGDGAYLSGTDLRLENSGIINGTIRMYSEAGSTSTLINSGQIDSPSVAVVAGAGEDTVINSGLIRVGLRLGAGDDRFIDKGGHVTSAVSGGAGDDLYVIKSDSFFDLRENDGEGFDTVKSSVSWTLDYEFEAAQLTGKKNVDLTASNDGALLYGNVGNNRLTGGSSVDWLTGGRGNDILTGESDADHFVFKAGSGKDVITDFEDGADRINLETYKGIDGFGDLAVKQHGDDVVVTFADGDQVTIRNFEKANLTDADFVF